METTGTPDTAVPGIADAAVPVGVERLIDVPGLRNLRDAGGFATADGGRVREGLLFRSGSLGDLGPEGARQLAGLDLNTVVDLRSEPELVHWPDQRHGLSYTAVSLPTLPPFEDTASGDPNAAADQADRGLDPAEPGAADPGLRQMYVFMAEVAGPPIAAFVRRLLEPGALPALVHCAVGKDRTGITVAVLLSALGVAEADITDDYLVSNAGLGLLGEPVHYLDENGVDRISRPVHPELLTLFLERTVGHHGSAEAFLRHHGVTDAELRRLRELLTRPV
ncbi:tyrosine-protein phosphatase [Streptacidiphilus sp. P02-A3a]|uniref:tyrosine-protein phosphatase n=1 Tax=Streptacidiphilus sp. P02-A3a TaxID=2704468 RepID=UPI0015FA1B0C|nr:tyrosine-protein phosphatase [Streptacidiphilus sp. P02-A3a]QMU67801.1 tyrosine-protein phosphatase [Streptacidiphilus sp. P02-A3a]